MASHEPGAEAQRLAGCPMPRRVQHASGGLTLRLPLALPNESRDSMLSPKPLTYSAQGRHSPVDHGSEPDHGPAIMAAAVAAPLGWAAAFCEFGMMALSVMPVGEIIGLTGEGCKGDSTKELHEFVGRLSMTRLEAHWYHQSSPRRDGRISNTSNGLADIANPPR